MKIHKLFVLTVLLGGMTSCESDFLDQKNLVKMNADAIFTDSTYSRGVLNDLYSQTPMTFDNRALSNGGFEIACDEAEPSYEPSRFSYQLMKGAMNPSNVEKNFWINPYKVIRKVNNFLNHKSTIPVTPATLQLWEAQARFIRAWNIFLQVKLFGAVPLVYDQVFDENSDMNLPRNTYEECINYIVSECDAVKDILPLEVDYRSDDRGTPTRGAALALKSRVLLYAASPLVNTSREDDLEHYVSYGNYDKERWKAAYDAAKEVIGLGVYSLYKEVSPYLYNLMIQPEPTSEDILYHYSNGTGYFYSLLENHSNPPSRVTRFHKTASAFPIQQLVDAFPMKDGKPIQGNPDYPGIGPDMYKNRDPRLTATVCYNGMKRQMYQFEDAVMRIYTGAVPDGNADKSSARLDGIYKPNATITGYYRMKSIDETINNKSRDGYTRPQRLVRYAEILLNAAEAANEYFDGPTAEVYEWLELIRDRAQIDRGTGPDFYGIKRNMTQDEMRKFIQNERRIELAYESHRYWDIRRWKIAEDIGTYWSQGMEITRHEDDTYTYRLIDISERQFTNKLYWWPIPASEITKSPNMKQNPGY